MKVTRETAMTIERIGRSGAGAAVRDVEPVSGTRSRGDFAATLASVRAAAPAEEGNALTRVRSGEIGVERYVDEKVKDSIAHLSGLPKAQIAAIERHLRDALAHDPVLTDLVARVTASGA